MTNTSIVRFLTAPVVLTDPADPCWKNR